MSISVYSYSETFQHAFQNLIDTQENIMTIHSITKLIWMGTLHSVPELMFSGINKNQL